MPVVSLSKQSFIAVINFVESHPKRVLAFCVMMLFSVPLFRDVGGSIQDLHVYQNVAHTLFNGGVLYKDAIDTKNAGFFVSFMLYFLPYSLIFKTMAYYHVFQAVFLSFVYWLIAIFIVQIGKMYTSRALALVSAALALCFMATMEYTFMMNQSQIGLLVLLFFIWYLMKTASYRSLYHYLIYGALIGVLFTVASPYIFICLIIPIIAWDLTQRKRIFVLKGVLAFLGFLLAMMPLLIYFSLNDALISWFEWTFIFPAQDYNDITLMEKISLTIRGMMGSTPEFTPWVDGIWAFAHYSIMNISYVFWGIMLLLWVIKRPIALYPLEKLMISVSFLTLIARFTLVRGYLSYNLYIIPLIFLPIPVMLRILYDINLKKILRAVVGFLVFWFLLIFIYITIAGWKSPSHKFDQFFVHIVNQNITKTPTYISGANYGNTVSYSTRWKSLYYSAWDFQNYTFSQAVMDKKPEVIFFTIPKQKLNKKTELDNSFLEFIDKQYKVVPGVPYWYIRRDVYDSWDLTLSEDIKNDVRRIKMDFLNVDLYGK
ncbi:MAG: hypothetical protein ACRC9L_08835 [Brevinema sp.]